MYLITRNKKFLTYPLPKAFSKQPANIQLSRTQHSRMMHKDSKVDKFIVFKIADYLLALPIGDVVKVVSCSPSTDRELRKIGLVQLGKYTIRVLDLCQHSGSGSFPQTLTNLTFLVVLRTGEGELLGIAVEEPPNLMDLSLERMRTLPNSESHVGVLELVSHAIPLYELEVTKTIFLLDKKRILNTSFSRS